MHFLHSLENPGADSKLHCVFFPGGPGFGSESLIDLTQNLEINTHIWRADFPGDGSNRLIDYDYYQLSYDLVKFSQKFDHVIFVGHSFAGMFFLMTPGLEDTLDGLILLCSAPNARYKDHIKDCQKTFQLPDLSRMENDYFQSPSDATFKEFSLASLPYFFKANQLERARERFNSLPFNHTIFDWSQKQFLLNYESTWVPQKIPTLIIGADDDCVTPLSLFRDDRRFHRDNIEMVELANSSHFPWFDDFAAVEDQLERFVEKISRQIITKG